MSGLGQKLLRLASVGGFTLAGLGVIGVSTLYTVDGGERAIIYDLFQGIRDDVVKGEGTHVKIPYIQQPIIFDVRIRAKSIPTQTGTKGDLFKQICNISQINKLLT
jgi:regulator of protease activity HflC (stomatin/prohibitin superfamily)